MKRVDGNLMDHWIVKTGTETLWFVSNTDNIEFSENIDSAVKLNKSEACKLLADLMIMQQSSSFSKTDEYTLVCVKS